MNDYRVQFSETKKFDKISNSVEEQQDAQDIQKPLELGRVKLTIVGVN